MQWKFTRAVAAVAALAFVAGSPLAAQTSDQAAPPAQQAPDGPRGPGRRMMAGPAEMVLSERDELQLTADQVQRLEKIRDGYAEKNRPLMDELRGAFGPPPAADSAAPAPEDRRQAFEQRRAQREAYLKAHPEAAKAMRQLRDARQAERKEVTGVLTSAQRDKLRQTMADRRGFRGRGRDAGTAD
jgi:Spy/CpxP family protein refolding chaperone